MTLLLCYNLGYALQVSVDGWNLKAADVPAASTNAPPDNSDKDDEELFIPAIKITEASLIKNKRPKRKCSGVYERHLFTRAVVTHSSIVTLLDELSFGCFYLNLVSYAAYSSLRSFSRFLVLSGYCCL